MLTIQDICANPRYRVPFHCRRKHFIIGHSGSLTIDDEDNLIVRFVDWTVPPHKPVTHIRRDYKIGLLRERDAILAIKTFGFNYVAVLKPTAILASLHVIGAGAGMCRRLHGSKPILADGTVAESMKQALDELVVPLTTQCAEYRPPVIPAPITRREGEGEGQWLRMAARRLVSRFPDVLATRSGKRGYTRKALPSFMGY
jgi:hypothetical protein